MLATGLGKKVDAAKAFRPVKIEADKLALLATKLPLREALSQHQALVDWYQEIAADWNTDSPVLMGKLNAIRQAIRQKWKR